MRPQAVSVTVGGPANDTFVFKPDFSSDVIADVTSSDAFKRCTGRSRAIAVPISRWRP
jgi:hypothetical protein